MSSMCRFGRRCSPPKTVILPLVVSEVGEDIHRQVEPQSRRVAADRRRAEAQRREARLALASSTSSHIALYFE